MKEVLIKLPLVEIPAGVDMNLAKFYEKNGRYVLLFENGDVAIADVQKAAVNIGEARPVDEACMTFNNLFIGQPTLLDPKEFVHVDELEKARLDAQADIENLKCEMEDMKSAHENELRDNELECHGLVEKARAEARQAEDDYTRRKAELESQADEKLKARMSELEMEYKLKQQQLELETPKRFGQGEWVSGKTLKEIIEVITNGKKE